MFPDVKREDRCSRTIHEGIVLIWSADDGELTVFFHQPSPAGAKANDACFGEGFLERVEGAEGGIDGFRESARWGAAGVRTHDVPEKRVVPVATTVVADSGADGFRNLIEVLAKIVDTHCLKVGVTSEGRVDIGDVSIVMAVVMDFHRERIDVGFQRIISVWKRGKCKGHIFVLFWFRLNLVNP